MKKIAAITAIFVMLLMSASVVVATVPPLPCGAYEGAVTVNGLTINDDPRIGDLPILIKIKVGDTLVGNDTLAKYVKGGKFGGVAVAGDYEGETVSFYIRDYGGNEILASSTNPSPVLYFACDGKGHVVDLVFTDVPYPVAPPTPTPTPIPPLTLGPLPRGLGGAGGGPAPPPVRVTGVPTEPVGVIGVPTDPTGTVTSTVTTCSADGKASVTLPAGTKALDAAGNPLTEIRTTLVTTLPASPPSGVFFVGKYDAYLYEPTGATFDPPVQICIEFDPADFPEGTAPVMYTYEAGTWKALDTTIVDNKACVTAGHFSVYAPFAAQKVAITPTSIPTPTPAPAITPTPTLTPTPAPPFRVIPLSVILAQVVVMIIVAVAYAVLRRRL